MRTAGLVAASVVVAAGVIALTDPTQVKPIARALGIGQPHRLLPEVFPAVDSADYSILHTDQAGDPVTYDPCKPLKYVVNPAGAPVNYLSFIEPAIQKVQKASGLKFVYVGLSGDTWQTRRSAEVGEPILISFPNSLDRSVAQADTVGLGGSTEVSVAGIVQPHYLTGSVSLLSSWFNEESSIGATAAEESVVMHELGHVLGLGHVQHRDEVMYPTTHGQMDFGIGDLAGLARLGAGRCED
ncbi:MAG TPA: matrixin family metalloprotease [Marmoricola sp.]|nr:matrixin family metalloprotease [Marmoricola sp.]